MRHLVRALAIALIVSLPAAAPIAATTSAPAQAPVSSSDAVSPLSTAKVVIIVGPVEGQTSQYRSWADLAYAEAIKWSSNVVYLYSPNATWEAVKPALEGASVVIYMGHGNGWPSPWTYDPTYSTKDGLGLNASAGNGDNNHVYYGEPYLAQVTLAPNAVVLLNHLCYASGNSEGGDADPTLSVAMQRVDNYGQGFFKAGAQAVIAEGHGSINGMIRDLFSTQQTVAELWRSQSDYNHNEFSFQSMRSPYYTAFMDPDSPSGGYYRSLVGNPDLRTEDITAAAFTALQTRLAGPDRYSTAAAISGATYAPGVPTVYLATGLNFPDALAGAAAAGFQHAPILLVSTASIPAATAQELTRLNPSQIIVLGSTGAVSSAVSDAAQAYTTGTVTRLAGSDRYSTAAAISAATYGPGVPIAYLATGLNFPDALAGAAAAGSQGAPILLVSTDAIPAVTAAELARLQPGRIVVLGGESVVSAAVSSAAAAYTAGGVTRLAGGDRYSTAAAISSGTFAPGVEIAYVATGLNFPDALAGAAAAGSQGAPILLLAPNSIPAATAAELTRLQPHRVIVLGSTGVISEAIRIQLQVYAH